MKSIEVKNWLVLICFLIINITVAQNQQFDLANEYFNKADYEKAEVLYDKLSKKDNNLELIYDNYRTTLLKLSKENDLKDFIKDLKKTYPENYKYEIDYLLTIAKTDEKNYQKNIDKLIVKAKYNQYEIEKLASAFNNRQLYQHSEQLYKAARAENKLQKYAYAPELASLFKFQHKVKPMVDEYINTVLLMPNEMPFVQNSLQVELKPEDYTYLESKLYERLSEQSSQLELANMLVWHYVQKQDFYNAFVQSRSIDKKLRLHGRELFELAELAFENRDYKNAIKIYEHLASNYNDNYTYVRAKKFLIRSREQQVKTTFPIDSVAVKQVLADYNELLTISARLEDVVDINRNRALLYAFYLHQNDSAIAILNGIVNQPRTRKDLLAQSKLDLGDIYLLNNEPWESTLLYSQVEKLVGDDRLGHEAKLKNAKLSFYRGDFELAQANLDVLKLATTREIANDAMDLSLLIQDNLALDTSDAALKMYSRADLLLFQKKPAAAQQTLDSLLSKFKNHSLRDEAYWLKAKIAKQTGDYAQAEQFYKTIIEKYSDDILGDDALFELAQLYQYELQKKEEAMEIYKNLMINYPGSIYVAESRKMYRVLRGDRVN